ncbi:MAG TPA: type II secretion system major pseudopilin GspG [Xanthomonadaceae bacterium]|nr:type II secretion system major pseudopilin GspG [Xanthomonadaceae bacterium]
MNRIASSRFRQSGMSLIEMLAVIVLIGIVGAVIWQNIGSSMQTGKMNAAKAQVQSLSMKIEAYALDNGSPPQRLEDLVRRPGDARSWNGPYARESDLKDPWKNDFVYRFPGEHGNFDLISLGSDGRQGGDGHAADIGNWE